MMHPLPRSASRRLMASSLVGAALILACSQSQGPVAYCSAVFPVTYLPSDTTVSVGDTLTMRVQLNASECYPVLAGGVRWVSSDTSIVVIDPVTGLLTARAPGVDTVRVHGVGDSVLWGGASVEAVAP